jgi:hypothetical protein
MACLFIALELKLWRAGVERVYGKKRVVLAGKSWHYRWGAFAIGFLGFAFVMLGVLAYADIRFQTMQGTVCWLMGAIFFGWVDMLQVGARLKYFEFDHEG